MYSLHLRHALVTERLVQLGESFGPCLWLIEWPFLSMDRLERINRMTPAWPSILTISRVRRDVWPDRHSDVNEQEPERDERHEVVELVWPIHDKTQNDDEKVHPEHHLEKGEMTSMHNYIHGSYTWHALNHVRFCHGLTNILYQHWCRFEQDVIWSYSGLWSFQYEAIISQHIVVHSFDKDC